MKLKLQKSTTRGNSIAMDLYELSLTTSIAVAVSFLESEFYLLSKSFVAFADDFIGSKNKMIEKILKLGSFVWYYPNRCKSWLVVKDYEIQKAI